MVVSSVVGDGEYIIYIALAWRNKSFGNGISFAWGVIPTRMPYSKTRSKHAYIRISRREVVVP